MLILQVIWRLIHLVDQEGQACLRALCVRLFSRCGASNADLLFLSRQIANPVIVYRFSCLASDWGDLLSH
ncbi:hypothetical protein GOP47_0007539 [Adiantum capillus-veneris]|uniref:Secreted protein n=1 Tax=Adiantum capillus-veneris TaxID=13818 RepID=A0A9D4V0W9_ADICA|nr:hypothetical protein GOP47_0007539 [Adiantum capillus-veneris]